MNSHIKPSTTFDNTYLAYVPERAWRTPDLEGRELTVEIAEEFPPRKFKPRKEQNNTWGVGEELIFSVKYGFYRAGKATMSILETKEVNGGFCYYIQTTAKSNDFISKFYKVDDRINSYIDVEGLFSRRFEKKLREGKYRSNRIIDFYHNRLIALNTQEKYALVEIPMYVQDILSALYYLRTFDLRIGKNQTVEVYADGKVYPLKISIKTKEIIEVPAGKFRCLKIEPSLKSEGIFKQKGRITIWLTDDDRKIPVKMTSKILIGSIATYLESYTSGIIE
ncbi:DUF3108 domain-containing protein [Candidatus Latescibacterota bacterium]